MTGQLLAAIDVVVPVLQALVAQANERSEFQAGQSLAGSLVGLALIRAVVTGNAERDGVLFPMADHVADAIGNVLEVVQANARMQLAVRAEKLSQAKAGEALQ